MNVPRRTTTTLMASANDASGIGQITLNEEVEEVEEEEHSIHRNEAMSAFHVNRSTYPRLIA